MANQSIGKLILIAVIVGAIASLSSFLLYPTLTPYVVLTVISVGVIAGSRLYASEGNVPGTPIPLRVLVSMVWTAILASATYFVGLRSLTVPSLVVGAILVLTYLLHELGFDIPVQTIEDVMAKDVSSQLAPPTPPK